MAHDAIDARRIRIAKTILASLVAALLWAALGVEWVEAWCRAQTCNGTDVAALALPVAWGATAAFIAGRATWSWCLQTWLPGLAFLLWSTWSLYFVDASSTILAGPVMAALARADLAAGLLVHGVLLGATHIGGAWLVGRLVPPAEAHAAPEGEAKVTAQQPAPATTHRTDGPVSTSSLSHQDDHTGRPRRPALQGAIAAAITITVAWFLPPVWRFFLIAALLVLTGGIYAGLGLADGRRSAMAWEGAQAALLIVVVAAATLQPLILAAGWLLHPLWDIAHPGTVHTRVPAWVVPWCLVYDLVLGAATMAWALTGGLAVA